MATDAEKLSKLFKNVHISQSRRGSDAGVNKAFYVAPHHSDIMAHSGGSAVSGRVSPSSCQLHVPPGVNQERRGSTGNILWRKGSAPHAHAHAHHLQHVLNVEHAQRRGSTPGDFLVPPNRKDSRKFSQDSIDMNEPFSKERAGSVSPTNWTSREAIIEEEVRQLIHFFT